MVKKNGAGKGKAKKETPKETPDEEEQNGHPTNDDEVLKDVDQQIADLRIKAKEDEEVDFNVELRKIQDQIADARGVARRPKTAKPGEEVEAEEEEEVEEEVDPDAELKELVNKRLTTCMLLALSFESDEDYPRDFYEKLAESNKLTEVVSPITKEEIKILNTLLKERKQDAKTRVDQCDNKAPPKKAASKKKK